MPVVSALVEHADKVIREHSTGDLNNTKATTDNLESQPPESVDEKELDAKIDNLRNQINKTVQNIETEMKITIPVLTGRKTQEEKTAMIAAAVQKVDRLNPNPVVPKKKFTLK